MNEEKINEMVETYIKSIVAIKKAYNLYTELTCIILPDWDDILKTARFFMEELE